ncbi:MAG: TonB-dependent receptor plug domain-containing protein [Gemmatimonadota bacterium]|nr:TonB-dependent receptor plug domain-containing protein [Gemmatimonadota bacterium]
MLWFSQKSPGSALLARPLLAGILLGFVSGCARPATTSEAEPEAAPQEDRATASAITSSEVQKRSYESIANLLQGRTAGVQVAVNPNGSISVRIRGAASFYGSSEPLYVVDGIPFNPGPGGALTGINPYDIESIEVLKYPPETSLYGVRGANGVIVIKTKRPDE